MTVVTTLLCNLVAIVMVRVWNPSREARQQSPDAAPESIPVLKGGGAPKGSMPDTAEVVPEVPG